MLRRKYRDIYYFFGTNLKKLDNGKTIAYKLNFTDSFKLMPSSFSNFVNNLSEIYSKKRRDKNCKSEWEFKRLKNNKISYNCKACSKKEVKTNKWIN